MKTTKTKMIKKAIATTVAAIFFISAIHAESMNSAKYKTHSNHKSHSKGHSKGKSQNKIGAVSFGLTGGMNLSNLSGVNIPNTKTGIKPGLNFGANVNIGISKMFSIQPELLFSGKGTHSTFNTNQSTEDMGETTTIKSAFDVKEKLAYIELPLLAKIRITNGLSVFGGPYLAYLASYKVKGTETTTIVIDGNNTGSDETLINESLNDVYNSLDYGMVVGAGYELNNGIGFSVRYTRGLSNIAFDQKNTISNSVIGINASYRFGK